MASKKSGKVPVPPKAKAPAVGKPSTKKPAAASGTKAAMPKKGR